MPTHTLGRAQSYATIAEAVLQGVGVALSDVQLAIGIAMSDEAEGHRRFRARRKIRKLAELLAVDEAGREPSERSRDRSLAAALPAFHYASRLKVHVVTADDERTERDAELYRAVAERLGGRIGVLLPGADRGEAYTAAITVGAVDRYAHGATAGVAIVRAGSDRGAYSGRYSKVACLPDPVA